MKSHELLTKSIQLVMEDHADEVVFDDETIKALLKKITLLFNAGTGSLDFLVVVTDRDGRFVSDIKNENLEKLVEILKTQADKLDFSTSTIKQLNLEKDLIDQYVLDKEDTIKKAYNLFREDRGDTFVVLDGNKKYIGKIKRNNFVERIKLLQE